MKPPIPVKVVDAAGDCLLGLILVLFVVYITSGTVL